MELRNAVTPELFREVMGRWVTGVAIVTGNGSDEEQLGMAVNSFTSLSLDPPLVLFCPALSSSTWPRIEATSRFAVNILAGHQGELARSFARSGVDKFRGVELREADDGLPAIDGAVARLVCTVQETHPGGDHQVVVGRVESAEQFGGNPLAFHRGSAAQLQIDRNSATQLQVLLCPESW